MIGSARVPPPPRGKRGWPWEARGAAPAPPRPVPRITVITPSLNHGEFIEETLRSVVMQGWPDLEYLVIDGGSTDGTSDVLRTYDACIAHAVSEPDGGQADAINKGLRRATGDVVTWFNADDVLAPGALAAVAEAWRRRPRAIYAAPVVNFPARGRGTLIRPRQLTFEAAVSYWSGRCVWHDPGLFWSRAVVDAVGEIDASLGYAFDYDYLLRALQAFPVETIETVAAGFRVHGRSKMVAGAERMFAETSAVSRRYWPRLASVDLAGFERSELEHGIWRGLRTLRRGEARGLAALFRLGRQRPARVALVLSRVLALVLRARLVRLAGRAEERFR